MVSKTLSCTYKRTRTGGWNLVFGITVVAKHVPGSTNFEGTIEITGSPLGGRTFDFTHTDPKDKNGSFSVKKGHDEIVSIVQGKQYSDFSSEEKAFVGATYPAVMGAINIANSGGEELAAVAAVAQAAGGALVQSGSFSGTFTTEDKEITRLLIELCA